MLREDEPADTWSGLLDHHMPRKNLDAKIEQRIGDVLSNYFHGIISFGL